MSINKLKGLLVALALCVAPASFASTLPAFDGELTVAIGGADKFFSGVIDDGDVFDYWKINLTGSQGTTTAASAIFGGDGGMNLYHWNNDTQTLGDFIASAIYSTNLPAPFTNGGYVLSAFLTGGSYVLRIAGNSGNNSYSGAISAVPLPGAALLFGSALFGAGLLGRKKLGARRVEAVAA